MDETNITKTLISISERMTKMETTLDHMAKTLEEGRSGSDDVEKRLRALEADVNVLKTTHANTRSFNNLWVTLALIVFTTVLNTAAHFFGS